MSKAISDIDFVSRFNPDLAKTYKTAKNLYIDAPIQTLVELRGLLEALCNELIEEYNIKSIGSDLHEKVECLKISKSFRPEIIEYMHSIRKAGNQAAHREQGTLSFPQLSELALSSLQEFCKLIDAVWQNKESRVPSYKFSEVINSPVKEWCYQALFHSDTDAKYKVGIALLSKYKDELEDGKSIIIDQSPLLKAIDFIEEAAQGFHHEAMFEYGHILLHGLHREVDIEQGKQFIYCSASDGLLKAKVSFVRLILETNGPDIETALQFAKEAAESGDGQAQYLLSKIYSSPHFKTENEKNARYWHSKAVASGDPDALFEHASEQLRKANPSSDDVNKSLRQLEEAAEKGHRAAYRLYVSIFKDLSHPIQSVRSLFSEYLNRYPDDFQIHFELAEYLFAKGPSHLESMKESILKLIQLSRIKHLPVKLKTKINKLSPIWLREYENVLSRFGAADRNKHIELLLNFKVDGTPHADIFEVGQKMQLMYQNPELTDKLLYKSIFTAKTNAQSTNNGRNALCKCGSGKKFKRCCALQKA